jgi:ankyrin repeat protein
VNEKSPDGDNPLLVACNRRRTEIVRLLLDHGANPNVIGVHNPNQSGLEASTPLIRAAANPEIVALLLDHGADPNLIDPSSSLTPLGAAASISPETVKLLLDHHADPNLHAGRSDFPLSAAASAGNEASVRLLLAANANPNAFVGMAALQFAVIQNNLKVLQLLLDAHADPNVQDRNGDTALYYVVRSGAKSETARKLLEAGADPRIANSEGITPLYASMSDAVSNSIVPEQTKEVEPTDEPSKIWDLFLAHGADINAATKEGKTALHVAMENENLNAIEWLIGHGADLLAKVTGGGAPLANAKPEFQLLIAKKYLFPRWLKLRAVTVFHLDSGVPMSFPAQFAFDQPPFALDALLDAWTFPKRYRDVPDRDFPQQFSVSIYREVSRGDVSEIAKVNLRLYGERQLRWPLLQWGDVLVVESSSASRTPVSRTPPRRFSALDLQGMSDRSICKVDVQVGEKLQTIQMGLPDVGLWSATSDLLPQWTLSDLVTHLADANPRLRLDQVKLQRTIEGKQQEWVLDLRQEPVGEDQVRVKSVPANLADGDKLIFLTTPPDDREAIVRRKSGIFRVARGGLFGEKTYSPSPMDEPHTLCQLIADSDLRGRMLIPNPDFSRVVIHRLKEGSGAEEDVAVNLMDLHADVPLQWGDIVEIPSNLLKEESVWTGIDTSVQELLRNVLTRSVELVLSDKEQKRIRETAQFRPLEWKVNSWVLNGHAGDASTDIRDHFSIKRLLEISHVDLEKIRRVHVLSGDKVRQISIEDLNKYDPRFQNRDVIEPVLR